MKRKQKNRKAIALAMAIILLISVGYAAISTNLKINGTANISKTSWSVYFTNVVINENNNVASVVTAPTVPDGSTDTTQLNWEVEMDTPGQIYEFNVDVKNDGTIDAMIGDLANSTLEAEQAKYLSYTVTYSDGSVIEQYDKLASGKKVTLNVKLQFRTDINAEDLPSQAETISLSYESNYVQADSNAKTRNMVLPTIGSTVNYTTKLNNVTLDNWKVFYTEGDYIYIILDDYLPNSAVNISGIEKNESYVIYPENNRKELIDALTTKSNWNELLTGTFNGNEIDYRNSTNNNVYAMGSPTLDLWVDSWNKSYPNDKFYVAQTDYDQGDGLRGYYIGTTENPTTRYLEVRNYEGYNNSLYFPHQDMVETCLGYSLASPSADSDITVIFVSFSSYINGNNYNNSVGTIRPVICLPVDVLN